MDMTNVILMAMLAIGIISNNSTVSVAVAVLLLMRLLQMDKLFPYLEHHGLTLGITFLTIGVLAPIASARITPQAMWEALMHWQSLLAVAIGIFVAYLGGKGVELMTVNPIIVTGLLIGTILGVALFKGVPVGPLIAAGMMAFLLQWLPK